MSQWKTIGSSLQMLWQQASRFWCRAYCFSSSISSIAHPAVSNSTHIRGRPTAYVHIVVSSTNNRDKHD